MKRMTNLPIILFLSALLIFGIFNLIGCGGGGGGSSTTSSTQASSSDNNTTNENTSGVTLSCPVSQPFTICTGYEDLSGNKEIHDAVDLISGDITTAYAVAAGRVFHVSTELGNVDILLSNNIAAIYGHLETIYVKEGQTVTAGQRIGTIDTSGGCLGGPRLHFELQDHNNSGANLDPLEYVSCLK